MNQSRFSISPQTLYSRLGTASAPLVIDVPAVVGVVMNLAIWFAIHTIFRAVQPVRGFGFGFDAPVLSSVDPWALALSAAAMLAIFRFKAGMLQTLAACSAAGIVLHLAGVLS